MKENAVPRLLRLAELSVFLYISLGAWTFWRQRNVDQYNFRKEAFRHHYSLFKKHFCRICLSELNLDKRKGPLVELEAHHVKPIGAGGENNAKTNSVLLCKHDHKRMAYGNRLSIQGSRLLSDYTRNPTRRQYRI